MRPDRQVRHALAAVAGRAASKEAPGHRHPQRLRPLEEEVLRFPLHPHPGEEVPRQLLRLQAGSALILLFGLLCRYRAKLHRFTLFPFNETEHYARNKRASSCWVET